MGLEWLTLAREESLHHVLLADAQRTTLDIEGPILTVGCASATGWLWVSQRPKEVSSPPMAAKWLSTMQI